MTQHPIPPTRSKSVPPDLSSITPDSASYCAASTSLNMRPHEISMAQLNHAQIPKGAGLEHQGEEERGSILFNAYPRDGYPNYAYVQKRYL